LEDLLGGGIGAVEGHSRFDVHEFVRSKTSHGEVHVETAAEAEANWEGLQAGASKLGWRGRATWVSLTRQAWDDEAALAVVTALPVWMYLARG
jgi:hypothetical protein